MKNAYKHRDLGIKLCVHKPCSLQHTAKWAVILRNKATIYLAKELDIMAYDIINISYHDFAFFHFSLQSIHKIFHNIRKYVCPSALS